MKKYLVILAAVLLSSCGVQTSTPEKDALKIRSALNKATSAKDVDDAEALFYKYKEAYEEEIYNGKRNIEDLEKLVTLIWQ